MSSVAAELLHWRHGCGAAAASVVVAPGSDRVVRARQPGAGARPRLPRSPQAESFAVRAVDVSGHRHPIATFDGRAWLVDPPRAAGRSSGARSAGHRRPRDQRRRAGLDRAGVRRQRRTLALGPAGGRGAGGAGPRRIGERRLTEVSTYVPAGAAGSAVYVDLTVRTPEPRWQGAVVGAWVLPQEGAAPGRARRAASAPSAATTSTSRIPRRHPLGIAVAGRGGVQTWVMYNRSRRRRQLRAGRRQPARAARAAADSRAASRRRPHGLLRVEQLDLEDQRGVAGNRAVAEHAVARARAG